MTAPKKWGKKKLLGFARLVNHDTNTGWVVESICLGEVIITDPNVERRTMDEFVELLKWRASKADQDTIDKFMASK